MIKIIELLIAISTRKFHDYYRNSRIMCRVIKNVEIKPHRVTCVCDKNDWQLIRFVNCAGTLYSAIQCKHCKTEMASSERKNEQKLIETWNRYSQEVQNDTQS